MENDNKIKEFEKSLKESQLKDYDSSSLELSYPVNIQSGGTYNLKLGSSNT